MARTATTIEEKIQNALAKPAGDAQEAFPAWVYEVAGIDLDLETLKVRDRLYTLYTKSDAGVKAIEARKEAAAARKAEANEKKRTRFLEQAKALGFEVTEVE